MPYCLVVDDSRVVRKVARRIVEDLGFSCEEAEDGQKAYDSCAARMPDAILLDWNMPIMSGIEFLEKLRAMPDGDGTVLDHSLLAYGAGMADSNGHASDPLPMVLAGNVGQGHRHVELPVRSPIGNLWLNVAAKFGARMEQFGDSTGVANVL